MRKTQATVIALALMVSALLTASPIIAQTLYTSPTYGYSFTLPAGWTVQSESSENGTDTLRFTNGDVVAFLEAYPVDQTPTACIEEAIETIESRPQHANFAFAQPIAEENGKATAVFGYTFITAAGEQLEGRDRITCWSLPAAGAMVRLEFLLLSRDLVAQEPAMAEVESIVATALAPLIAGAESDAVGAATPVGQEPAAAQTPADAPAAPAANATVEPSPTESTAAPAPQGDTSVNGNSYVSPSFGYGLTWSDAWTVSAEESDNRGDYLGLEHVDGIFADLIGEPYPQDTGGCFDFIADFYTNHEDYSNVVANPDATSAAPGLWDFTGTLTMTTTNAEGTEINVLNYLSCTHIPGESAMVSLEQAISPEMFDQLKPEMDALRQGFAISATGQTPETAVTSTATPESAVAVTPTAEPAVAATETPRVVTGVSGVTGNTYVSPSFGYRITWDEIWTVDDESSSANQDYLALTNGRVYAELLSEQWDPTQGNCFEWIVDFYATNAEYIDVRASQDAVSAVPGVWDFTGAIAMTDADATTNAERIDYVACSEIPGQQVIVSLEQFVFPIDAPGQLNAMDALRESFSMT